MNYFYETKFEIRVGFGPAGSTENFCKFAKVSYFAGGFFMAKLEFLSDSSPRDLYIRILGMSE